MAIVMHVRVCTCVYIYVDVLVSVFVASAHSLTRSLSFDRPFRGRS